MTGAPRKLLLTLVVTALSAVALLTAGRDTPEYAKAAVLKADGELTWYKGNLHTHSLWSDGDDYLEMIALWYKEHDYDFLGFTDHNVVNRGERWTDVEKNKGKRAAYEKLKARFGDWIEERTQDGRLEVRMKTYDEVVERLAEPGKFLLIQGEEISDRFGKLPVHMNATNVQELIPPLGGNSIYEVMQNNTNALIAQRERTGKPMMIHLNHPNFHYGVTAEDLMRVRGENFFEVYNGHPGVNNSGNDQHASTERIWDIVLTKRLGELGMPIMYGLGTDDGHNYHDIPSRASEPGRGWVMVLAKSLSPADLIAAMEQGRFYASSGVTLEKVVSSKKGLEVSVAAESGLEYSIEFLGTRAGYNPEGAPVRDEDGDPVNATLKYGEEIGAVLKRVDGSSAKYEFTGDELYVRARVTSSRAHPNPSELGEFERAWVQPVEGPAAMNGN